MTLRIKEDDGFSMIAVLAVTLMLSVVALGILNFAKTSSQAVARERSQVTGKYLAEAAIEKFRYDVISSPEMLKTIFTSHDLTVLDTALVVTVENENIRMNVNRASEADMRFFFMKRGMTKDQSDSLAARILDWRDIDILKRPGGAESNEYRSDDVRPRNSGFESVGEIKLLLKEQNFDDLIDDLTVYSFTSGAFVEEQKSVIAGPSSRSYSHLRFTVKIENNLTVPPQVFRGSVAAGQQLIRLW